MILLPGLKKQLKFLKSQFVPEELNILIIGSGTEEIAVELSKKNNVEIIVEDYETLLNTKLLIAEKSISVKMMDFERTDYDNAEFNLIYLQGTITDVRRNSIVKEIKRILKPNGYVCIGEFTYQDRNIPKFIKDIFSASNLNPLFINDVENYYSTRGFEILVKEDASSTLKEYYNMNLTLLEKNKKKLNESEKSYYKKILNKISHESNAYLNLGGDKFFGFNLFLLKQK